MVAAVPGTCKYIRMVGEVKRESASRNAPEEDVNALPETRYSLVLRTDFSDDAAWRALCAEIQEPSAEGFVADVDCVSDASYEGLTADQLVERARGGTRTFAFLVDRKTLTHAEHPVLVVDLYDRPGRTFRVIPSEMWGVENNLALANMDYHEFADNVDPDGVFRGFPES